MDMLLEAHRLVDWISASLASPSGLPLPEKLAAAIVFTVAVGGLMCLRSLAGQVRPRQAERDELDEAA